MPGKKLVKGVGYTTIFYNEFLKVEISLQESTMRRTVSRNGDTRERLYTLVKSPTRIREIEFQSENWNVRGISSSSPYVLLEQMNASNKLTGYYKIIKKDRANIIEHLLSKPEVYAKYSEDDWQYYERRK